MQRKDIVLFQMLSILMHICDLLKKRQIYRLTILFFMKKVCYNRL